MTMPVIKKQEVEFNDPTKTLARSLFQELRGRGLTPKEIIRLSSYFIDMLIEEQRQGRNRNLTAV